MSIMAQAALTPQLIRVFSGQISGQHVNVVDARELRTFLGNNRQFSDWIKQRIEQYGFEENRDFVVASQSFEAKRGGQNRKDYYLTLDMAKELAMVGNNAKGREARRYFIKMERRALQAASALLACTAPEPLHLTYIGRHFRIVANAGQPWFVASDVAQAIGLRDSHALTRHLQPAHKTKQLIGRWVLNVISKTGLDLALLHGKPEQVAQLRLWLAEALRVMQDNVAGNPADGPIPPHRMSQAARTFTQDYLGKCRQAIRDAGGTPPQWDTDAAQRIADGVAAMLIQNKRWLLTFGDGGEPQLKSIPHDAGVFTPEVLLQWIRDPGGAHQDLIPQPLQAITERIVPRLR